MFLLKYANFKALSTTRHQKIKNFLIFILLAVCFAPSYATPSSEYVGSTQCAKCHQEQYQKWQSSHHYHAMEYPTEASVLGDFDNKKFVHKGVTTRFTKQASQFYIHVTEPEKKEASYRVAYTFGYKPLQQYLLDVGDGKYQAYDVAWDSRPKAAGGQRWYKLLANEETGPETGFHWTKQMYNWNSQCADCHSTGLQKNFNESSLSYSTVFEEANVACEACHGPGQQHLQLIQENKYESPGNTGFDTSLHKAKPFLFNNKSPIARANSLAEAKTIQSAQINSCGGCHSRRQIIGPSNPAHDFHDQFQIALLNDPLYLADGQIQDEVFVLGSFMQSKMFDAGVTCTHCHDAHSAEVKIPDNALCAQCHAPAVYDTNKHHKHSIDSSGAQCVNCHMAETTYMEVDARRDHGFIIPRSTKSGEEPNVCQNCHDDERQSWAEKDTYTELSHQARSADPLALRSIAEYINSEKYPAMRRATLLSLTDGIPSRLTAETIVNNLTSRDPEIRRSAIEASGFFPLEMRWEVLSPSLNDPSASVQHAAVNQLTPSLPHLSEKDKKTLTSKLAEHRTRLNYSADTPSGQAAIAHFELSLGNQQAAIQALNTALRIEPSYLPAMLNLADVYRQTQQIEQEQKWLKAALELSNVSSAAYHAYGLHLVRQKNNAEALTYLRQATEQQDSTVRFYYVYAVALESAGDIDQAINTLQNANQRWPNQFDLLFTLVLYLEKADRATESWPFLSRLSAIAPNHPEVIKRVQELQSR